MSNTYFQFKQFTVYHDQCAMKVGTDGVLLGAYAPLNNSILILDVGTGTGLIALFLAQREPEARITGIEIDEAAAEQARQNAERSPWSNRINIICEDFKTFTSNIKFDLIVSNPPYFVDALPCPDGQRNTARHSHELHYEDLMLHASHLLTPTGNVCLILPADMESMATDAGWKNGLYVKDRLAIYTKPGKPCKRVILTFGFEMVFRNEHNLYLRDENNEFSEAYQQLTRQFYLKF